MWYGALTLVLTCGLRITTPIFLASLIAYFNPESTYTKSDAYMYAAALITCSLTTALCAHNTSFGNQVVGMKIRVACCSLVYRKTLRLSRTALGQTETGKMVNLLSNDVNRFEQLTYFLHYLWVLPIQTIIIIAIIWQWVGVSAAIGVGTIFMQTIPVQLFISKFTSKLRMKIATRTDERVRMMSEIISGIQVIKMYAWEKPFEKMVALARRTEINVIRKASYLRGLNLSFMVFAERTTLFVTLASFVLMGNHITAEKVFSIAQYCNILNMTMAVASPIAMQMIAETKVSIKRLEKFLLQEEFQVAPLTQGSQVEKVGVTLDSVTARWLPSSISDTLHKVALRVNPGQLCAIIGPVGSGKSSLLQILLGELPLSSGSMSLRGEVSYASQEPWLFVGTVRQNILFGQPYQPKRYKEVVRVCALTRDFELFPNGDKTIVGERGVSLSGGQRARINLARAVYREADIYLLDDPLSAVDTHVGRHLFEECVDTYLTKKIRILVTHQLQYLKEADLIVILNNGQIETQGTFQQLQESKFNFAQLLTSSEEDADEDVPPTMRQLSSQLSNQSLEEPEETEEPTETQELMSKGSLKSTVYMNYFKSGGGIYTLLFLVVVLVLGQMASSGADYWVTFWTNQEELRKYYSDLELEKSVFDLHENSTEIPLQGVSNISDVGPQPTRNLSRNLTQEVIFSTETSLYIYTVCILGSVIITIIRSVVFFKVCMTASRRLHNTMFSSILQGTMRFFDTNPSGRVLNRFSKDMGSVDEMLPKTLIEATQIFLVMAGILVMVTVVNYLLMVPMVFVGLLFYKIRQIYLGTGQDMKRLEGATRSPVFSHLAASLNGLTTIRACGAQQLLRQEFDSHQDLHTSSFYLTIATSVAFGFWLDVVSNIFVACVAFSFLLLDEGSLGADVGLAISQSLILTGMLQHGIRMSTEVVNHMTAVERILEYTKIDKEPGPESEPGTKPLPSWPPKGEIQFVNTSMRYSSSDPPVLRELTFNIEPAWKVGIVGRTGAGKSSLISALFRLANLEGSIVIDQVDTQSVGLNDLRSRISIIPQEPVLFSASLRDNLDPFNSYKDDSLWNALEEVELKEAVNTLGMPVNVGGSNFSSGQRQLVCLARAILRNNKILVLDEATANVDPQTDALIQSTIRRKFADCTVLTIAHRLNTIMDSDRVLVMDAGTMVEFGHPYLLLQNSEGYFYKMVEETGNLMAEQLHQIAKQLTCSLCPLQSHALLLLLMTANVLTMSSTISCSPPPPDDS
uniref:Uncharacterized protein n=1 Tax=Timema douglasi TaxID=61478 RepID=A0A7R8VKQ2_TIMDO|nr:unnamed protein product [Timema douglasi]